jgi:hypothetical protein
MSSSNSSSSSSSSSFDPSSLVSCTDTFNALFACGGPAHQFDRYYKDGALDGCSRELSEMTLCIKLKSASTDAEKKELVKQLMLEKKSTTLDIVWPKADR